MALIRLEFLYTGPIPLITGENLPYQRIETSQHETAEVN